MAKDALAVILVDCRFLAADVEEEAMAKDANRSSSEIMMVARTR